MQKNLLDQAGFQGGVQCRKHVIMMHGHAVRSLDIGGVLRIIVGSVLSGNICVGRIQPASIPGVTMMASSNELLPRYCHIISTDHSCGDALWQGIPCHTFRNALKMLIDSSLGKSHRLFLRKCLYISLVSCRQSGVHREPLG